MSSAHAKRKRDDDTEDNETSARDAMAALVRTEAMEALRSINLTRRGDFARMPGAWDASHQVENDVWKFPNPRFIISTQKVLRTNVDLELALPEHVLADSDFEETWRLTELRGSDLEGTPLQMKNANGRTIHLHPSQVAAVCAMAAGPSPATRRIYLDHEAMRDVFEDETGFKVTPESFLRGTRASDAPSQPCFNWLVSTMGSGKTFMSLAVAANVLFAQWDAAVANLYAWTTACAKLDVVLGASVLPFDPTLRRAAFIVADKTTYNQWVDVVRANVSHIQRAAPPGVRVAMWPAAGYAHDEDTENFEALMRMKDDGEVLFIVMKYERATGKGVERDSLRLNFTNFVSRYAHIAVPVVVLDEFARNAPGLTCQFESVRPLIYRALGVSATPSSLVMDMNRSLSNVNFAKHMLAPKVVGTTKPMKDWHWEDAMTRHSAEYEYMMRFLASDTLRLLRVRLSDHVASMMPPAVEVFNVRVNVETLGALFEFQRHDLFKMDVKELCDRLKIHIPEVKTVQGFKDALNERCKKYKDAPTDNAGAPIFETWQERSARESKYRTFRGLVNELHDFEKSLACNACMAPLTPADAFVAPCCTSVFCSAHADTSKCSGCYVVPSTASTAPPPNGSGLDAWLRSEMQLLQRKPMRSFSSVMRETMFITGKAGAKNVLVMTQMWRDDTVKKDERVAALAALRSGIQTACPEAAIFTMFNENCGARADKDVLGRLQRSAAPLRILLLHDGSGKKEQITGLDLSFLDTIVSLGKLSNPQQAYSRALRVSDEPRAGNIRIIRIDY